MHIISHSKFVEILKWGTDKKLIVLYIKMTHTVVNIARYGIKLLKYKRDTL